MSRPGVIRQMRLWWHSPLAKIALAAGIIVHLAGFLAFRVVAEPSDTVAPATPFISWYGESDSAADALQNEQALLFDSEALFLPTGLNAHHASDSLGLGNSDDVLLARTSETVVTGDTSWATGPLNTRPAVSEVTPLGFLAQDATVNLISMGQVPYATEPVEAFPWAEVRNAYTGQVLGRYPLEGGAASSAPIGFEFMLYRTPMGTTGKLLPLSPSTDEQALRAWSQSLQRADWQLTLPEGYYHIIVSP